MSMAARQTQAKTGAKPGPRRRQPKADSKQALEQAAEATVAAAPNENVQHPGVAVLRVPAENGAESLQIVPMGGLDKFAIPSLLEFAIKATRKDLGLEDK